MLPAVALAAVPVAASVAASVLASVAGSGVASGVASGAGWGAGSAVLSNLRRAAVSAAVARADALVLEDYNKGVLVPSVIEGAIQVARSRGIPIIVDPKYRNFFSYRGATVFKPNRRELESALGAAVDLEHAEAIPNAIERLGVEHLLLTLGERGMVLASRGAAPVEVPTVAREVYDVVGAGDTVTAYLAAIMGAGGTAAEAALIANYAAGVEVGKLGAATVSPEEVLEAYDHFATERALPSSDNRAADILRS